MSMPKIPEENHRPSLAEVTVDLLKSVAMEETALSHILNAEGERSQAIVRRMESCCLPSHELAESMRQSEKIISTIIMKEWLLLKKLETTLEINLSLSPKTPSPCPPCQKYCPAPQHQSVSHCLTAQSEFCRVCRCNCRCYRNKCCKNNDLAHSNEGNCNSQSNCHELPSPHNSPCKE